jgi:hypothetical protein
MVYTLQLEVPAGFRSQREPNEVDSAGSLFPALGNHAGATAGQPVAAGGRIFQTGNLSLTCHACYSERKRLLGKINSN